MDGPRQPQDHRERLGAQFLRARPDGLEDRKDLELLFAVATPVGNPFDEVVGRIRDGQVRVKKPPGAILCKECDLCLLWTAEGIFPKALA